MVILIFIALSTLCLQLDKSRFETDWKARKLRPQALSQALLCNLSPSPNP